MLLSSLLDPELVKTRIKVASREEAIQILLKEMFAHYQFQIGHDVVLNAVKDRENLGGTVLPTGLSVPHARIDLFNDILIGIASLKTPILENGIEVHTVVLLLTSKTTSNLYLNSLAAFAKISQNKELFAKINAAATPTELISLIHASNIEVKKELTVEHIMGTTIISVSPEDNLKAVIDLFVEHNINYLPVIDSSQAFVGEITVLDTLRLGIPNYAQMIGNISFLKSFEPLEDLLEKEETIKVRDVFEKPAHTFTKSTSIIEAVSTFTKSRRRYIPVLEDGKLVGIISYMDILKKVLRG